MAGLLIALLLTAVATFLAQSSRTEALESPAVSQVQENEKEQNNRLKLTRLLSSVGVRVGPTLQVPASLNYREVRLSWESFQKVDSAGLLNAAQLPSGRLMQISSAARIGALPRQRSMELSTDHVLVVALDESEAVRWWRLMIDPRLVRAEVGRNDAMQSENLYLAKVDFIVECPDDPALQQLRFFRPIWNGESFQLEPLGTAPLR